MAEKDNRQLVIDIILKYADTLSKEIQVNKIILYGSYSKLSQHKDSDIDIAVISPEFTGDRLEDQFLLMKYRRNVDLRIEPMPFRPEEFVLENPFVREIIETGIEIPIQQGGNGLTIKGRGAGQEEILPVCEVLREP